MTETLTGWLPWSVGVLALGLSLLIASSQGLDMIRKIYAHTLSISTRSVDICILFIVDVISTIIP